MKNRITELFSAKKSNILSVFYTAGYPKLESTVEIARQLELAGADLIEIGIPFSDPVADGPVIQASNKVALDNGMTVKKLLSQVRELRKVVKLPIILMGYVNPVMQYGVERFCKEAGEAGVDGLILPDLPIEEYLAEYKDIFESAGLLNTFLISPTTSDDRIRMIDQSTTGFIYAVSASSTTGKTNGFSLEQESYFKRLKGMKLINPFLIGFGISDKKTLEKVSEYGSGGIVGSAFINKLKDSDGVTFGVDEFIHTLRG